MNTEEIRASKKDVRQKIPYHLFVAHLFVGHDAWFILAAEAPRLFSFEPHCGQETGQLNAVAIHSARTASQRLCFLNWIPQLADGYRDGKSDRSSDA